MASDSSLRLLIISQNFPSRMLTWSGEFLVRQARLLAAHEIATSFLVPRPAAPWPLHRFARWKPYGPANPLLDIDGLPARPVSFIRPPGAFFFPYEGVPMSWAVAGPARAMHRDTPFDVVVGVQMNGEAQAAVSVGKQLGIPVAALAIGTDVMVLPEHVPALRDAQARTLRDVDLPLAVSRAIADRLESTGGCRRRPFVMRLSPDPRLFRPRRDRSSVRRALGLAEDDVVGVFVGRLEAPKGMDQLCRVLPPLLERHPRFRMLCLGDGSYRSRLVEAGDTVRSDAVVAPGFIDPAEIPDHLAAADLLIFPSHSEGLPQAVLEAMHCGLPVIATDVGGTSEAVIDGETGLLIPPCAPGALEEAIERLLKDPTLRATFGQRGRAHARAEFDPAQQTLRLAEELRATVAAGRRA